MPRGSGIAQGEVKGMSRNYEAEGDLEGDRVIRLKEPLPIKEGRVKVVVTPKAERAEPLETNLAALDALSRFLGEPDNLTPQQWAELEKVIEDHPIRIRKGAPA